MFFQEYLSNMFVLAGIATVIAICLLYIYDLFEKKQYTNAIYLRIGILVFVSCLATIYITRLSFLQVGGGGASSSSMSSDTQNMMPQPNEIRNSNYEHFKTGIPTF